MRLKVVGRDTTKVEIAWEKLEKKKRSERG